MSSTSTLKSAHDDIALLTPGRGYSLYFKQKSFPWSTLAIFIHIVTCIIKYKIFMQTEETMSNQEKLVNLICQA